MYKRQILYSLDFADEQNGWAVGNSIFHTLDGGTTWTEQAPDVCILNLHDVYFVDARTGWTVGSGGMILHTSDGGVTWIQQDSGISNEHLLAVYFTDAENGWVVGDGETILRTSDGGRNWNVLSKRHNTLIEHGLPYWQFRDVYFIDEKTGWIVGGGGTRGVVLYTTDGGNTWTWKQMARLSAVDFADRMTGAAVGNNGTILLTTDGGLTWIQTTGAFYGDTLYDIDFVDAYEGWIVGGIEEGIFLHTVDGGRTWDRQSWRPWSKIMAVSYTHLTLPTKA